MPSFRGGAKRRIPESITTEIRWANVQHHSRQERRWIPGLRQAAHPGMTMLDRFVALLPAMTTERM
jgi:hypothetical protein